VRKSEARKIRRTARFPRTRRHVRHSLMDCSKDERQAKRCRKEDDVNIKKSRTDMGRNQMKQGLSARMLYGYLGQWLEILPGRKAIQPSPRSRLEPLGPPFADEITTRSTKGETMKWDLRGFGEWDTGGRLDRGRGRREGDGTPSKRPGGNERGRTRIARIERIISDRSPAGLGVGV